MSELQEPELPAGTTFGAYRIVRPLGVGMSGTVYEALELAKNRRVALKVLHASVARKRNMVHRFMREATAAAKLQHPHIVATYDVGQFEGQYFLAMEILRGENLAQRLKREGRLTPRAAADIFLPVLAAVARVHEQGIVHRDLKPDNVFLVNADGRMMPKLLDFGLSKDLDIDDSLTQTSVVLGTPAYMSPEQTRGAKNITPRTDQWALGVMLYECVTGVRPFSGTSLFDLIHNINTAAIRRPAEVEPDVPADFEAVVLRAMERDPERRFGDVRELGAALHPFASRDAQTRWEPEFLVSEEQATLVASRAPGSFFPRDVPLPEAHTPETIGSQVTVPGFSLVSSQASVTPILPSSALASALPAPLPASRLQTVEPPPAAPRVPDVPDAPVFVARADDHTPTPQETSQARLASRSVIISRGVLFASGTLAALLIVIAGVVALTRSPHASTRATGDGDASTGVPVVAPSFDEALRSTPPVTPAPPPDVAPIAQAATDAGADPLADASAPPLIQHVLPLAGADAGADRRSRRRDRRDRQERYYRDNRGGRVPMLLPRRTR